MASEEPWRVRVEDRQGSFEGLYRAVIERGLTMDEVVQDVERFGGYPQPKPQSRRVVEVEVRATQNGCRTCGGTGLVPGGVAWEEPGFLPCPACGWKS